MRFFAENNRPGFECPPAGSFSLVGHLRQIRNQPEPFLVCAAVAPHSRNLGGSPDEGTSEPPRDGAVGMEKLRPSPLLE